MIQHVPSTMIYLVITPGAGGYGSILQGAFRSRQRAAACRFTGSMDTYYDDLNYENARFDARLDNLVDVLEWLEENCPLLMRQMGE